MNKIVYVIALTISLTASMVANAQETLDTGISQGDLDFLKTLACAGDTSDSDTQASLAEMESLVTQILTNYGVEITDEQLESLGAIATDAKLQLEAEESVKAFCSN
ncbi:hypothetical protein Xen7305DRAFT_00039060 [Xenococcus sp. PCC 7305]|uniref:hypothetical protein n=1 Tax=Xenococcus sp. PCC 7305 TaxID=102125 RepID=UPI0002AC0AD9|nr:hypothetical protein [Xenococcus sp. PCC 7305]ELS04178.1 hypothetical protein Xen7305DRAFT_00039060 [Xenococcus sp. PCC 7305]